MILVIKQPVVQVFMFLIKLSFFPLLFLRKGESTLHIIDVIALSSVEVLLYYGIFL